MELVEKSWRNQRQQLQDGWPEDALDTATTKVGDYYYEE
jgi:hypothetical protein